MVVRHHDTIMIVLVGVALDKVLGGGGQLLQESSPGALGLT